ncbi:hypothetical protein PG994_003879 [Apiospora phragmitis]|uniref:Uncharacterized protein n=1 Tax=Apiospora phragmitis TaxID=2905665 RepID=A0ABR1VZC9_9PEZI
MKDRTSEAEVKRELKSSTTVTALTRTPTRTPDPGRGLAQLRTIWRTLLSLATACVAPWLAKKLFKTPVRGMFVA